MAIWTLARFLRLTAVPRLSPICLRIAAASPYFAMAWAYSPRRWWATPIAWSTSPCPCSLPSWGMSARAWTRGPVTALVEGREASERLHRLRDGALAGLGRGHVEEGLGVVRVPPDQLGVDLF